MSRHLIAIAVLVLLPRASSAQMFRVTEAVFISGASLDAVTTYHNVSAGAVEANPLLAPLRSPLAMTAAMVSTDVGIVWLASRLRAKHDRLAVSLLVVGAAVHWQCGSHNLGVWGHEIHYVPPTLSFTRTF